MKNQIQLAIQDKNAVKDELDEANSRRENMEKAVERLKIELLNRNKELE